MLPNPAKYLRTLRILHQALCGAVVLFAPVVLLQKQLGAIQPALADVEPVLLAVAGGLVMAGIAASVFLFRRRLEDIRAMPQLERKLPAYQSAQVIRWALAEGPAMVVVVLMLLTTSSLFLVFAAAALAYLFGSRPPASVGQACDTMNVSLEEQARWEKS